MKWRVMVELIGSNGTVHVHKLNAGRSNTAECSAETVGLKPCCRDNDNDAVPLNCRSEEGGKIDALQDGFRAHAVMTVAGP
jgi:hypothetical protein